MDCTPFEPRTRPWYVAASTARKIIIFMVDQSGSMSEGKPTRMDVTRQAVGSIVRSLSNTDGFGIVTFNKTANTLVSDKIMLGTKENQNKAIDALSKIETVGKTDYLSGFSKAF